MEQYSCLYILENWNINTPTHTHIYVYVYFVNHIDNVDICMQVKPKTYMYALPYTNVWKQVKLWKEYIYGWHINLFFKNFAQIDNDDSAMYGHRKILSFLKEVGKPIY